jgi:hypothetical protein
MQSIRVLFIYVLQLILNFIFYNDTSMKSDTALENTYTYS